MKKEQKYYYGNPISDYGMEHGYVDYATLAKCFDAVLNNDIMSLTYDIGSWEEVSGTIDNTDGIEELEEKRDELEEENENNPSQILENEIYNLNDRITELESEQDDEPEVFQWFIVDDWGARLLQDINEIVYYNETLDMYLWGVTHYGTSWDYVLTSIAIDWQALAMVTRKQLNKLNNFQVLLLALIKFYFYICFDLLIMGLFLGLSNIVLPLIYN